MVDAVTTNGASSRVGAGTTMLASNFQTFLTLLTSQLKNQDPLSPVDSNQFTAQLTQMAGVEQQLLTNDLLTSLLGAQQAGGLGTAATYIGKDVTAGWSATTLKDGAATWSYELGKDATSATLQVVDGTGKVVWTGAATDLKTGVHDFTWDGKTTAGGQMSDGGVYSLKITAANAAGKIDSQVLTRGRITGVELYNGEPYLTVGNSILPLSSVIALQEHTAVAESEDEPSALAKAASALNPLNLFS